MLINVDIGQRTDVDLVFALLGKCIGSLLIQSVDSLDDQNIVRSQLFEIALVLPLSGLEVEGRQFHPLSGQQSAHIVVKLLHVNGFETFKIVISVFIPGGKLSVHKIIIQSDGMGHLTQRL